MRRALDIDPRYSVDTEGNVYGVKGQLLKPWKTCVGGTHLAVTLGHSNKQLVHRLVARTFIPNPENKPDVAHWDNNGLNNRVGNLRWATEAENAADRIRHGTTLRGERHPNAKLTDVDVWEIRQHKSAGAAVDEIAYQYGVSRWTIYDACNPKRRQLADY